MKKHNAAIAEDTHALKKLDTLIEEENPYAKEPGGTAYIAKESVVQRAAQMYSASQIERGHKEAKESNKEKIIIAVVAICLITLVICIVRL